MIAAALFDLDGTLADTAPDLGLALNRLLERYDKAPLPLEKIRPQASHGARGLLDVGFNLKPSDPYYEELRDEFLELYEQELCRDSVLFPGMEELLTTLEQRGVPWGIVTNKIARFTVPLVKLLKLDTRAACVVSGDTYARPKPYPDPLIGAAQELKLPPERIVYVGDDERDMIAGNSAGMQTVVARYGYLSGPNPPEAWEAHGHIQAPLELLGFMERFGKA